MNTTLIDYDIVKNRQAKTPELKNILEKSQALLNMLEQVTSSPLVSKKPQNCEDLKNQLSSLIERLRNKVQLFSNGVITVSVAGVEKSGKTTLLKNLTGIEHLPTADERCTSVSCEILYVEKQTDEGLNINYYTRDELLGVVQRQLTYLQKAKDLLSDERQYPWQPTPQSIEAFSSYSLPAIKEIAQEKVLKYKGALDQLTSIQHCIRQYAHKLGCSETDSILNLPKYASHKTAGNDNTSDLQPIIRKITVHKHYAEGSPFLRLCDTPGVDDPNPYALEHTFESIKSETDLLIIANRPLVTPSITGPLAEFIGNLKKLDPSSPLRDRSIFFVNWQKPVDPEQTNAKIRIAEVKKNEVFPEGAIYGPCDIMDRVAIKQFLVEINKRLRNDIPKQDKELILKFNSEWGDIKAEIRTQVLKPLRAQTPPMPEATQTKLYDMFDKWFSKDYDSDSPKLETAYFMGSLNSGLNRKTATCSTHSILEKLHKEIITICKDEMAKLQKWLEENASEAACADIINGNGDPRSTILPTLGVAMTDVVEKLTAVVEDIAPVVQEEVYDVIKNALASDEITDKLCPGDTAAERLQSLCIKLKEQAIDPEDEDVNFIIRSLNNFADASIQMNCIMRHELRPALNLMDPNRWHHDRRSTLVESLSDILVSSPLGKQCITWLKNAGVPSTSDPAKAHSDFYTNLCKVSFTIIQTVLLSNSNKFEALLHDFLSDASQTLATQNRCKNGWRKGLRPFIGIILQQESSEMLRNQENAIQFKKLVDSFESVID